MNTRLKADLIGQAEAVEVVTKTIHRSRDGFDEGELPIGSFLIAEPTDVGKTELAKHLAVDLFDSKKELIRLDMSEYSDRTTVSKLIGTAVGYIGYDAIKVEKEEQSDIMERIAPYFRPELLNRFNAVITFN